MPVAGANVYFAADEEKGSAYGVSTTVAGVELSLDSKQEALAKATGGKRSNTVGASYTAGAMTLKATYDSIKDGDQWGVSAAYAAGAMSLNLSTDEGSDWSASGAYALGSGASVVGGMNYTEDAYLGLSLRILSETPLVKERAALRRRSFLLQRPLLAQLHSQLHLPKQTTELHVYVHC